MTSWHVTVQMDTLTPFTHLTEKKFSKLMCYFQYKLKKSVLHGQLPKLNMAYPRLEAKVSVFQVCITSVSA